jgi:hypothetical protein
MFSCLYVDVLCVIVDHESCKMLTKQPRVSTKLLLPLTFFVIYYQRFVFFFQRFLYLYVDVLDVFGDETSAYADVFCYVSPTFCIFFKTFLYLSVDVWNVFGDGTTFIDNENF